jgi:hypothetical protein
MKNNDTHISDFAKAILKGTAKALRKLVEASAAGNKSLVIGEPDGKPRIVPAKDLLKSL